MSDDDIELGICLDELDPVLEQALFASRIQQQTATNPSDLEKLIYIELLCMRELETSELTKPPPTDDFVSVLLTKLIPTGTLRPLVAAPTKLTNVDQSQRHT
jgi:hypothetical protein